MKILFVDQFSEPGGAQLVLRDLIEEVGRRNGKAELAAPGNGPLLDLCPSRSLPLPRYANGSKTPGQLLRYGWDMRRAARVIREMIDRRRPDFIYANGPRILPAAVQGLPLVFHAHSFLHKRYARWIANACLRGRDTTVIASSRFVAEPLAGCAPITIYNGVSDQTFAPRPLRLGSSHVGIIGRIAPEKGQLDFIEAARAISRSGRHVRVSVFGAGLFSDPQYEKQLRRAAADSEIEFRGWADPVSAALNEIDVLAVPSNGFEATPRVIMEAFSAGTPVVAYPSGGIRELIRDGETGVLTCSATSDSLARSLADLLNKPELMAKLSAAGRREWETRFQRDRQVGEICDLLWRVHAKQSRQSGAAPAIACVDDVA